MRVMPFSWTVLVGALLTAHCGMDPARLVARAGQQVLTLASPQQRAHKLVVSASYIVAFRSHAGASKLRFASFASEFDHHFAYLAEEHLGDPRVRDIRYITTVDLANPHSAPKQAPPPAAPRSMQLSWTKEELDEVPAALSSVQFASPEEAEEVLKEWEADGLIWFAEPNYVNKLMDNPVTPGLLNNYSTGGPSKGPIWWHKAIMLPQALQKMAKNDKFTAITQTPVVAVLDSGLDIEHESLKNHIWSRDAGAGNSGCDNDVHGCNTTVGVRGMLGDGDVFPYLLDGYSQSCEAKVKDTDERGVCEHGTHVAGIIASDYHGNGSGDATGGVCPFCRIMPIKIIKLTDGAGTASDEAILLGFKYLTRFRDAQGGVVRVANSSFGKYARSRATELVVSVLREAPNEVLVVGAASNDDSMLRSYPAAFTGVISVAATGANDEKAAYSNFGPWVTVSAPGGNSQGGGQQISSTLPGPGKYGVKQGTSMASPVVAGIAGLILAYDPSRGYQQLYDSIVHTTNPRIYDASVDDGNNLTYYNPKLGGESDRTPLLGSGIVDASAAIDNSTSTYVTPTHHYVAPGCSTIAAARQASTHGPGASASWLVGLLMIMPLAWVIL